MRPVLILASAVAFAASACAGPEDAPSKVHDLRVLGIRLEPPELMAASCTTDPNDPAAQQALMAYAQPIEFTALLEDPHGGGRALSYELWACEDVRNGECTEEGARYLLAPDPNDPSAPRTTQPGELKLSISPALLGIDFATGDLSNALLLKVQENDTYKGLGGIRVPLVLHVKADDEEIYAQKLMVYSCNFFPQVNGYDGPTMTQNVNPALPGVHEEERPWAEGEVPLLQGAGPFVMGPEDFHSLQEHYVVPSFELEPVELDENWKIAWHTDLGQISPNQTGGADYGSGEVRHRVEWSPGSAAQEQDVNFWFVVRDGRGGTSWLKRTAHYKP